MRLSAALRIGARFLAFGLILALIATNILLQRRNRDLTAKIQELEASDGPLVGSTIPLLIGNDLNGNTFTEDFSKRNDRSLLLVFSAVCKYSRENWPNWSRITASAPNVEVVFADSTGQSSTDFFRELGVPVPNKIVQTSELFNQKFNLRLTPTTVLLGPGGAVRRVFLGVLNDKQVREIKTDLASR